MTLTSFVIVIQKRAVVFYAVGTHDGIVDFELVDEIDGRHTRNAAIQGADHAGSDDNRVVGTRRSDGSGVDIVGDNPQVLRCLTNSAATASMVVPMLIKSEALSGMVEAISRARRFFSCC